MVCVHSNRVAGGLLSLLAWLAFLLGPAFAFTPESPEVKKLVEKGLDYLIKVQQGGGIGERVLMGLTFYKTRGADHPVVKKAVEELEQLKDTTGMDVYSHGIAVILVAEVNRSEHAALLQRLVDELIARQKSHGGFGYDGRSTNFQNLGTGDISQTQYAVLAMWTARQAGATIPQAAIVKACDYLLRVQDPTGGWGYQGVEPPSGRSRVQQNSVSQSLTAGGLGSICVCADLMGMHKQGVVEAPADDDVPSALKVVKKAEPEKEKNAQGNGAIPFDWVETAINDGTGWFAKNYTISPGSWKYYYMYGLERCESFRELYLRRFNKEPKWYNDGVAALTKEQLGDGSWNAEHGPTANTCFAVLFLVRSSRKAISKVHKDLGDGVLTSGRGLPTNLANASVKHGKLVDSPFAGEVNDLLSLLDDPENPELIRLAKDSSAIKLDPDLTKRQGQITKLKGLVSTGNWESRMIAVRTLGQSRDLDSVPMLLYALTDPDVQVVKEADSALRFISRKFRGVGYEGEEDKKARDNARTAWRIWYLAIRPDAELLD